MTCRARKDENQTRTGDYRQFCCEMDSRWIVVVLGWCMRVGTRDEVAFTLVLCHQGAYDDIWTAIVRTRQSSQRHHFIEQPHCNTLRRVPSGILQRSSLHTLSPSYFDLHAHTDSPPGLSRTDATAHPTLATTAAAINNSKSSHFQSIRCPHSSARTRRCEHHISAV